MNYSKLLLAYFAVLVLAICIVQVNCQDDPDPAPTPPIACTLQTPSATFDLTELWLPDDGDGSHSYKTKDIYDSSQRNYTYWYNVCGDSDIPPGCGPTDSGNTVAPAFQVSPGRCYRLSNSSSNSLLSLIDDTDPTKGIQLSYFGGDRCSDPRVANKGRTFTIRFLCADHVGEQPDARVTETATCAYTLSFKTIFACPLECGFASRKMCGGHGLCALDSTNNKPRCFCNSGMTGLDCTEPVVITSTRACDSICIALSFVVLILFLLIAIASFLLFRVRKLEKLNLRFTNIPDVEPNTSV